jgi:2-dehydropantoate 2-reductase
MKPQKVAIVGTGAMGSVYAALMAEAGNEVWAVDTWTEHVDAINALGLRVEGASGDRVVRGIRAVTELAEAEPCDLYVIATKGSGVGTAAKDVVAVMPDDTLVLTIQNGLGAGERIAEHMPAKNVLLGVADGFGASMKGPGHVHHNAMKLIRLGEMSGGMSERLRWLEARWQRAGFNARAFDDIHQLIWEKFLCNVTLSAPCTVFDCTVGELMAQPDWREIALRCMHEAHVCGLAEGIRFSFDDPVHYVTDFAAMMPKASPSMRLDHMASRPSEIDAINAMVPVVAARHGLTAPFNQTLSAVVCAREAAFGKGKT